MAGGIDLFLWVCPLVGVGVLVGAVLTHPSSLRPDYVYSQQLFDVPGRGVVALTMASIGLPLVVALFTRRLLGFLAGACLLLGVAVGTGWVDSHGASRDIALVRLTALPPHARLSSADVCSQGGGVRLVWVGFNNNEYVQAMSALLIAPRRDRSLTYRRSKPEPAYLSNGDLFDTSPALLRRMGFGLALHSKQLVKPGAIVIPFDIALPYWFLCLLAIPFPLAWTMRWRKRRRIARRAASGLCQSCGYDLRATPDAGGATLAICPECGAVAERAGATVQPSS